MKCIKCKAKQGKYRIYSGEQLCDNCFCRVIEKRVRKEVRLDRVFRKNDRILILDDGSKEYKIAKSMLKSIIKDLPATISEKKVEFDVDKFDIDKLEKYNYDRIIIPWNLDKEVNLYLKNMFYGKKQKNVGYIINKKYVKLLRNVMDFELEVFAKIKKIRYKERNETTEITEMLDDIEKKYPGSKFSMLKSVDFMEKLIMKN